MYMISFTLHNSLRDKVFLPILQRRRLEPRTGKPCWVRSHRIHVTVPGPDTASGNCSSKIFSMKHSHLWEENEEAERVMGPGWTSPQAERMGSTVYWGPECPFFSHLLWGWIFGAITYSLGTASRQTQSSTWEWMSQSTIFTLITLQTK